MGVVTGGGGGGFTPAGATLTLNTDAVVASNATVPFDVALQDPHGFFNAATHQLVVPAGLAGLYLYGFAAAVGVSATSTTAVFCKGSVSGNADNLGVTTVVAAADLSIYASVTGLERFAVGDAFSLSIIYDKVITVFGGNNATQLWMLRVTV